jgi:hypothetical protein
MAPAATAGVVVPLTPRGNATPVQGRSSSSVKRSKRATGR